MHDRPTKVDTSSASQGRALRGDSDDQQTAPIRIALTYLGFGLLWVWLSDSALIWSGNLSTPGFWAATGKGTIFVVLSSLLVYQLVRFNFRRVAQTNALLQAVAEVTPNAVFVKDLDGKYLLINQAAARFVGKSIEEVLGRDDTALYEPDSASWATERDRLVITTGRVLTEEVYLTAAGVTRTYFAMKAPYRDELGSVVGVVGIAQDITEQKRASELLEEKESFARAVLDSMTAHVAVIDANGVITRTNEPWITFAKNNSGQGRLSPRTECGSNYLDVCRTSAGQGCSDSQAAYEGIQGVLAGSSDRFNFEYACHSPHEQRWFLLSVTPLGDSNSGAVVSHFNITDRIRAEESLRGSEQKFRALADAIPQIVWTSGPDGGLNHLNAKATEYTGIAIQDLTGWSWGQVIHPDDLPEAVRIWTETLQRGVPQDLEFRIRRIDGQYRWHITRQVPARNPAGEIIAWYGTCTDIEDLKQVESVVRRSQEMLRLVLDNIPQGVFWKDRDSIFRGCNRVVAQAMGLSSPDAIEGMSHQDLSSITPEEAAFFRQKDWDVMEADKSLHHILETMTLADGRTIWLDTSKVPLHDEQGRVNGVLGTWEDITERRNNEVALRTSETKLRMFVEHVSAPIAMLDRDMRYLYVSRRWKSDYQLEDRDLTGLSHYEVFPEISEKWKRIHQRCLSGSIERCEEDRFERANGSVQWLRWEIRPWMTADNQIGGLFIFSEVITQRKISEQALRDRERLLGIVTGAARVGLAVVSDQYEFLFANEAYAEIFGLDVHNIVGHRVPDLLVAGWSRIQPRLDRALAGHPVVYELTIPASSDDPMPKCFRVMYQPRIDDSGKRNVVVVVVDITEHKMSERIIRESEERYRRLVDVLPDAIFINLGGRVVFCNPTCLQLFGAESPSEVIGKTLLELFHPEFHDSIRERVATMLETRQPAPPMEEKIIRLDGQVTLVHVVATPIIDRGEDAILVCLHDLTERKKLEVQFQQAQKMEAVGRLAGGIAHDFNNLLTIILGYCDLVLEELSSDQPHRDWMISIRDAGERAARLTQQLLAFSRKAIIEPRLLDLNELVEESVKLFRRLIGENIILTFVADPNLARIKADVGQIEQIIMNLVVNAKDAMPNGGQLTITTKNIELESTELLAYPDLKPGRYARLTITDTGLGMSKDVKDKIFEPFFTTKEVGKGTGLGLAVVHGVLKQCDGAITVDSTVGVGTTFKLLIPVAQQSLDVVESGPATLSSRGTETVLLVEDEEEVRSLARIALESQGFKILSARNGAEALKLIEASYEPIQLLVTDVVMPEMGGRQLAEILRAVRPEIRVLYMSGYTDDAVVHHGIVQATDAFIQKPFTPLGLARKARDVLDENT